jgi:hypothetical protein
MAQLRDSSLLAAVAIDDPHAPIVETPVVRTAAPLLQIAGAAPLPAALPAPADIFDPDESAALGSRLADLRAELDQLCRDIDELVRKPEGPF